MLVEHFEKLHSLLHGWVGIVLTFFVAYFGFKAYNRYVFKRKHNASDAPFLQLGAWEWKPLFLVNLINKKNSGEALEWVTGIIKKNGRDTIRIGYDRTPLQVYITTEPENVKAILATQFNDFALGTRHAHFLPLLGDGIFTLDGDGWKHSRAMLRPQFAREQIAHVKALEPHLQLVARHIRKHNGNTFDLQQLFYRMTVDTATEFLFGESTSTLADESIGLTPKIEFKGKEKFADSFNTAQLYLATRVLTQIFYPLIGGKEFKDACDNVHKFAQYYVQKALTLTPDELEKKSESGYVFLYELVKETRNAKVLQDQLLNILVAGRDTTAGLLSFTFFELARNPKVWERLKQEINEHFGEDDVEKITFESLKKCDYLKWVINEVLRLYPSVPFNFRVATKDTTIPTGGGPNGDQKCYIGKGTAIGYLIYATHRLKKYYGEDADVFKPERWEKGLRVGWAYLPFNGGPRICLGQQFALTEASYIITRLVQLFPNLVSKDDKAYPPLLNEQLTMCLHDGARVQMT